MKIAILKPDGTLEVAQMGPELEDIYAAIGYGCDQFQQLDIGEGVMLLDEEAKLRSPLPPLNEVATRFCARMDVGLDPFDQILGRMVLVGMKDGELVDIPESLLTAIQKFVPKQQEAGRKV